jgi:dTDP-4-amino-4,6-dideoxygalactose transaminase
MHNQDFLKKLNIKIKGKFPISSYISKHGLYLPSYVGLSDRKIKEICDKLSLFLTHN